MALSIDELVAALRVSAKDNAVLRQANDKLVATMSEPVAIVGMGCRFPGGVSSAADLWDVVAESRDVMSGFPADRGWQVAASLEVRAGGFVHDADRFDAGFFGISPREALAMDPQQRVLLETCWEAIEHAGIDPNSLRGSDTGVFMGVAGSGYGLGATEDDGVEGYLLTGTASSVVSGRVSYVLGLEGPAVSVDTACSSSLVALHQAVQSVRSGESSLALAGGVTVMATPAVFTEFSRQGGLSADARCKAFADAADGTGWSEGAGVLVVERLSQARRRGHRVLAVVRGSAVNQDGASNGLTAPNGPAQQRVILRALANAGVPASEVDVVEAHGTGTRLGDPIEAQALLATYGQDRPADRPLWLGAVKSNIGHTVSAAGVAGVIKMVEALRRGVLPATLHVDAPSTQVDWSAGAVELLVEQREWRVDGRPRRAGVSSFGISGTNAHVILEQAPQIEITDDTVTSEVGLAGVPWVLSARSRQALADQASRLSAWVRERPDSNPVDIGWSLATTRARFEHRAVIVGADRAQLLSGLAALADGEPSPDVANGVAGVTGKTVLVFPGQGSQWVGMGVELMDSAPEFARMMTECAEALAPLVDWSLLEVLRGAPGAPSLDRTDVVQPVLFAVMVSLAELWRSLGVVPDAVVGHSQGEIAAAYVAGALSLGDAARLVVVRSRALTEVSGAGAMASVALPATAIGARLAGRDGLAVAAANGPRTTVVSGAPEQLEEFLAECIADGIYVGRIAVDYASHSPQVDSLRAELLDAARTVTARSSQVSFYSTVTAAALDTAELDAAYWFRNLRETVRFEEAVQALLADGYRTFVEASPHPLLTLGIEQCREAAAADEKTTIVGSLRRGEGGLTRFLASVAQVDVVGAAKVRWDAVFEGHAPEPVTLPTYAFQRQRFWLSPTPADTADGLHVVQWRAIPAPRRPHHIFFADWTSIDGDAVPPVLVLDCRVDRGGDVPAETRRTMHETLEVLQAFSREPRWASSTLLMVTRGTVKLAGEDVPDPAGSAVWGLVRSAQSEDPGRIVLVDNDTEGALPSETVAAVLASGEPQLAIRHGVLHAPRLMRAGASEGTTRAGIKAALAAGTVMITGGTGGLGAAVARHLVAEWGAASLMLVSRRGMAAVGAAQLAGDLTDSGARVQVVACDVSDRDAVTAAIAAVPDEFPLVGVVHAAGVLDDGVLGSLTPERIDSVLAAKADAAWYLHELTRDLDLAMFVLFSAAAGILGAPGQANYAAANTFLDGLAAHRRSTGSVATSIAWGLWESSTGMTGHLGSSDATRLSRAGVLGLSTTQGLALFDAAVDQARAGVVAVRLDQRALAAQARAGVVAPLLRELVPESPPAADATAGPAKLALRQRLSSLTSTDRIPVVLDLVRAQVAGVLGHTSAADIDPDRNFRELGFDSLTAVDARNRLGAATGLRLPATVVFDYPTPHAVARFVLGELFGDQSDGETGSVAPATTAGPADPVAIVGIGCRFPGGVSSPEDLWRLVAEGRDVVSGIPADRGWDIAGFAVREGGFVRDAGDFDAGFFGISPREALAMDPQQRMLLETCWEAVEHARIDPRSLRGSDTGVFIGVAGSGYGTGATEEDGVAGYLLTGTASSVVSGRVSYVLGLEGPAVSVDTACSSSLVALHQAVQAVRSGECRLALAGGVTVMASPGVFVEFSRQGGLAPDGRCKAFADAADGTGWSEGAGVLVVERLSDARRRGHHVLAVVRGSAVNQDGASNGLTAPNGPSQQRVIRRALAIAGIAAAEVDVVEAHGTGTTLGDPIEAQALLATYGRDRPRDRPLWLGSIKSNIGHTQAAAGVAGVIKMIEAMRHGSLPATLHVDAPSAHVNWSGGAVELLVEQREWHAVDHPRRAAVSAFGVSGTNAHVILEQAPVGEFGAFDNAGGVTAIAERNLSVVPWVVTARSRAALTQHAGRLLEWARQQPNLDPANVGWSLATTRSRFEHRAVVLGTDHAELLSGLRALAADEPSVGVVRGGAPDFSGKTALVFPGQGAQWLGMGRGLYAAFPAFATAFDEVVARLDVELGCSVRDVVWGSDAGALDATVFAQAGLFAVGVALFRLLESWGVRPDFVSGHSVGEVAAAHVAGVLSLDDAVVLVAARGRLMQALPAGGVMAVVAAAEAEVLPLLTDGVAVAAVNGPGSVVVSGVRDAVSAIVDHFALAGRRVSWLRVSHAFHSPLIEPMLAKFAEVVAGLDFHEPTIGVVSNVTGAVAGSELSAPQYWVRHVRETVRFADGIRTLKQEGTTTFLIAGPDGGLAALIVESLEPADAVTVPVLRKDHSEPWTALQAVARVFVAGSNVRWDAPFGTGRQRIALPTYAFQRQRYWLDGAGRADRAGDLIDDQFWTAVDRGDTTPLGIDPELQFSKVLPQLSRWRRDRKDRSALDLWRYRIEWKPLADSHAMLSGTWLLIDSPADPLPQDLVLALTESGARTRTATIDADRTTRLELAALIRSESASGELSGVLSFLASDDLPSSAAPAMSRGVLGNLLLLQGLIDAGAAVPFWCVTTGAVAVHPSEHVGSTRQAQMWGIGQVAGLELPDSWGGLVDLAPDRDHTLTRRLVSALSRTDGEDQLAVRASGVYGRRMMRASSPNSGSTEPWIPSGTVLITGGTGGIGAQLARRLAHGGAEHVVLVSRRGRHAPGAAELERELASLGARVTIRAADVTERSDMAAILAAIDAGDTPLTAVVHAAGVAAQCPITEIEPSSLTAVLAPKVIGAEHLDELLGSRRLDTFVLFSSGAATWGSAGGAGYAAANAFVNSLAERRRARGLVATALAWGAWSGAGMAQAADARQYMNRSGLRLMAPEQAMQALEMAVGADETLLTIADIDWELFSSVYTMARRRPLIADIPDAGRETAEHRTADVTEPALRQRLTGLTEPDQVRLILDVVRTQLALVLGHDGPDAIDADRSFQDLGFDSLAAVETRNRLGETTGIRMTLATLFDHGTPAAVAGHIMKELAANDSSRIPGASRAAVDKPPVAGETLVDLFKDAVASNRVNAGYGLLHAAARLRPVFESDQAATATAAVRLSEGTGPHLVFLCAPTFTGGIHQHLRIAAAFSGRRRVSSVPLPGFDSADPLPSGPAAAVAALAGAVLEITDDNPIVLVGHSAAGYLAQATAAHLCTVPGIELGGLVLLDTFDMGTEVPRAQQVEALLEMDVAWGELTGAGLTAMVAWSELLPALNCHPPTSPTLLITCAKPYFWRTSPTGDREPLLARPWSSSQTLRMLDTDHFAMVADDSHLTARAMDDWLDRLWNERPGQAV
ncbi:type I polyketide synthase [Nocardia sp. NPDC004278]